MADPIIRLATNEDLESITRISNWAILNTASNFGVEPGTVEEWRRDWERGRESHPWLVAELTGGSGQDEASGDTEAGTIAGFAMASAFKGRCAYNYTAEVTVYLDPIHHGKRIGSRLYERLLSILDAQGYRTLIAVIAVPNPASVRLHEALGFAKIGELKRVGWKFDRWHDVGYWQRSSEAGTAPPSRLETVDEILEA